MKHNELEDGDQLVTRIELREIVVSIHEEILAIHTDMLEIKTQINDLRETIRNKWWVPVAVAVAAMVVNTVAIIFAHH